MEIIFKDNIDKKFLRDSLQKSNKFKKWISNLESNFFVETVYIDNIYMFGPEKVGFICANVSCKDIHGNVLPGISFIRGDSVSIFVVIESIETNEKYVLLVDQARVPAGKNILESPAGMIDEGIPSVKAIEELQEEVGEDIDFSQSRLIELESGYTSPGGSDEFVTIYAYEIKMSEKDIDNLHGRITGNKDEKEYLTLKIIPFDEVFSISESIMTKLAAYSYKDKVSL